MDGRREQRDGVEESLGVECWCRRRRRARERFELWGTRAEKSLNLYHNAQQVTVLGVPILAGDKAIGAVSVQSLTQEGRFGENDVRLLTNNPAKVAGLEASGIRVIERVGHHMPTNPHNADYLAVKRSRSGHLP